MTARLFVSRFTFTMLLALLPAANVLAQPAAPTVDAGEALSDKALAAKSLAEALERVPPADRPLTVRLPTPRRFRLDNGLLLLVLQDRRLPTVTITMRARAGSFFEPRDRQGVAALTAAMLDEGTRDLPAAQLAARVDTMGASLTASAEQGGPMATIHVEGFSEDTAALLDLLADVARRPDFPAEPFEKVRRQVIADLVQAAKDPNALAESAALQALYGDTPPARVRPPLEHVEKITREDLSAFHGTYYRPERAILGVAGDVEPEAVARLVERAFGDWTRGKEPLQASLPSYTPARETRTLLLDRPGSVQTVLRLTNLGLRRNSSDYAPMAVMDHILGGTYTSRLWMNIRETKGYAYDVHSAFTAPRYPGHWYAGAQVRSSVTGDAVAQFLGEFERLRETRVPEDELEGAKQSIVGRFARQVEDPSSVLDNALDVEQYNLPDNYWQRFLQRVQEVDAGDVRRVARKYLVHPLIIAVGERADIEEALKAYGPVTVTPPEPSTPEQ